MRYRVLIFGFLFSIILISTIGIYALNINQQIILSFHKGERHFKEITTAATELSSYAKRAEGHLFLYLALHRKEDKNKFPMRANSLNEQISILDQKIKNHDARAILDKIKINANTVLIDGYALIAYHDKAVEFGEKFEIEHHKEALLKLHDNFSALRESGVDLAKLEIKLENKQKSDVSENAERAKFYMVILIIVTSGFVLCLGFILIRMTNNLTKEISNRIKSEKALKLEKNKLEKEFNLRVQAEEQSRASLKEKETLFQKIQLSENRFKEMTDFLPVGVVEMNAELKLTYINEAGFKIFEYTKQDLQKGLNGIELLHPDDREKAALRLSDQESGKYVPPTEYRILKKDGTEVPVLFKALPIKKEDEIIGFRASVTDISRLKQAETELRESEERLKETAKTANVGGWETDLLGNTLSWTEETFRIYELEDYRLPDVGKAIQYYHPEDQQLVSDAVQRAIETGAEFDFEIRLITEKKNLKWVRTIGNIVMHEGNRVGLRGMIQDITNRKKAEEKVIDMNNKLTSTLNAIPDVLFEVDREGRLYFYHDPVFELLYAPPDELMGNLIIDVLPQNVADIIFEAIGEAGKTGSHYGSVFKLDRPDGEKWFELPLAAKGDYKDPDNHLIVMARNITKRKQAEEQLNKYRDHLKELVEERTYELKMAKDEAEHANQLKSEFLANMSHELRTPMHHILSYSHIGIKRYNSPKDRTVDCFEKVTSAGERMMNLINNLLDLSKLESKKMEYTLKENDVLVIINENIAGLIHLPEEKGISITITQPTVSTKVICDRSKISQVIQNLLSNSMQFSGKNKNISISFDSKDLSFIGRQEEPTTLSLMVSINDEGPGIPGDELESIFDKFIQSSKTKTGAGGTGLGLSICKKIIEDHHGKIWAKNNPEGGATFSFMLPYEQEIN